ncbi:MAG: DNA polymerase III subunit chi [Proteobacteria bacterium]|nr:DNA polymerase III subunit chi [Pseudomonadota bacterium]
MTEISFYHLDHLPLERALPKLLEKVLERGLRALVLAGSEERVEALNTLLWTYQQRSFLPHGAAKDGQSESQPIFLTTQQDNPNGATVLVLVDGMSHDQLDAFDRCLFLFEGGDSEAVADARERWRAGKAAGHETAYWQQTQSGGWERGTG